MAPWPRLHLSRRPTAVGAVGSAPRPSGLRRGTTDDETVPPFGPLEHKAGTSRVWHKEVYFLKILDDGWPESVEEQDLLLLVWRRNFRNGL